MPYFLHWISLTTLESLEEIKQAVLASHKMHPRDFVKAEALPSSEEGLSFTMLITAGCPFFRPADGVALSRSGVSNREFVGEITEINGMFLSITVVWPVNVDEGSVKDIGNGTWCLHKFPSLVGYKRTTSALKAFQDMTSCGQSIYEEIVGTFCISAPASPTAHDESGNVEEGVQEGNCYKNFLLFILVYILYILYLLRCQHSKHRARPSVEFYLAQRGSVTRIVLF